MASPAAVITCLLAFSATCLLSTIPAGLQRRTARSAQQQQQQQQRPEDELRVQVTDPSLGDRAVCPFTTELVAVGGGTMTASTCVGVGQPCAGGTAFTVCQQLTQTVLVDGHSLEVNTACLCALRAQAAGEGGRQRRQASVQLSPPRQLAARVMALIDCVIDWLAQWLLMLIG